jgi:HK97 family phage prohead protease
MSDVTPLEEEIVKPEVRIIEEADLRDNPAVLAELREGGDFTERRVAPVTTEVRSNQDGSWTLVGHAAVFDSVSEPLGGFREVIQRGAFRKVLKNPDLAVKALFNHDQNLVLGSNTNGTMTLTEDPKGLRYEVQVADTSYGRDLRVLLERGDVTQSSFAFKVAQDGQSWTDQEDGTLLRTITDFKDLLDVSPVTYPAYKNTTSVAVPAAGQHSADVSAERDSSTGESEQATGGAVEQPGTQADSQPRRADEMGAHRHRARRLRLRDKRAA